MTNGNNATGLLFYVFIYLFNDRPYITVCSLALCTQCVEKCCIDSFTSHCRCFCSFFSSPAASLSRFFAAALFTLSTILPLSSPLQYPVLSHFSLPWPILFSVSLPLFLAPRSPLHSPPSPSLQPPYVFPVSPLLCSALHAACVCKVAEGGGRRPS